MFGIAFIVLAIYYWLTPANMLPAFLPGYNVAMTAPHEARHRVARGRPRALGLCVVRERKKSFIITVRGDGNRNSKRSSPKLILLSLQARP